MMQCLCCLQGMQFINWGNVRLQSLEKLSMSLIGPLIGDSLQIQAYLKPSTITQLRIHHPKTPYTFLSFSKSPHIFHPPFKHNMQRALQQQLRNATTRIHLSTLTCCVAPVQAPVHRCFGSSIPLPVGRGRMDLVSVRARGKALQELLDERDDDKEEENIPVGKLIVMCLFVFLVMFLAQ